MLPAAIAIGKNHIGTIAGKLNGLMIADDAERLADRVDVDAGRDALGEAALEQVRDAAGELDDLEAAGDLAERVGEHLAVLGGDDRGQLALALVEQLAEAEQHLGALGQRGGAPARERRARGGDRRVDVVRGREGDPLGHRAGRRVEDVTPAGRRTVVNPTADPMGDNGKRVAAHRASLAAATG